MHTDLPVINLLLRCTQILVLSVFIYGFICVNPVCAQEEEPFIYTDKGKRDPFIPLVDENGRYLLDSEEFYTFDELNIAGILWDPEGNRT